MSGPGDASGPSGGLALRALAVAALGAVLLAACGGDDDDGGGEDAEESTDTTAGSEDLLGPEDQASGEPVRIGMVSDGATQAFDNTDELRAAQATAEYWNTHKGGVGGRPVELVTCETGADPAGATDCANQLVEQDVAAVALSQSAVGDAVWEPLHAAGVPTMWFQGSGEAIATDDQSSFLLLNPETTLGALPVSVAESEGADKIAFVTIDVPQAIDGLEGLYPILEDKGIDHETVAIAPGTADMTSQMQQVAGSDAGVVHVVGNDAFCIAAFNGLNAVGYDGAVASITQCITDATREGVPGDVLEGTFVTSTIALGADDDPTFQLYEAVMDAYGQDVVPADVVGGHLGRRHPADGDRDHQGDARGGAAGRRRCDVPVQRVCRPGAAGCVHERVAAHAARRRGPAHLLRGRRLVGALVAVTRNTPWITSLLCCSVSATGACTRRWHWHW
jgi:branched-chain amino acid transport system substrate-binding protein